jgi:hypothetical protein
MRYKILPNSISYKIKLLLQIELINTNIMFVDIIHHPVFI